MVSQTARRGQVYSPLSGGTEATPWRLCRSTWSTERLAPQREAAMMPKVMITMSSSRYCWPKFAGSSSRYQPSAKARNVLMRVKRPMQLVKRAVFQTISRTGETVDAGVATKGRDLPGGSARHDP